MYYIYFAINQKERKMKAGALVLVGLSCVVNVAIANQHDIHDNHKHSHKNTCGHAAEWHVDHFDYEHDGHDHHSHANESHEATIKKHNKHKHGHSLECSHESRVINGRVEYKHDGHWHHQHGSHFHESHT